MTGIVAVFHLTCQEIGHGLEATMGMGWKTTDVIIGIIRHKMIQEQKGIQLGQLGPANDPGQAHTGTVGCLLADNDSLDASPALDKLIHNSLLA
jgi:hypothetical protein